MKVVFGLILYVIILSVLVYNNQLLSYNVLAESEESTSEEDSEDEKEKNNELETNTESEPPDLGQSNMPAQDLNPHDIDDPEITSDTKALDPKSDEQSNDVGEIADLGSNEEEEKFTHNARLIAMELSKLTPEETSQYPLTDLSNEDIKLVFGYLTPGNIARVLKNIPQEDLVKIQAELTPTYFDQTLLIRLSEPERAQVQDRILLTSDQTCLFC